MQLTKVLYQKSTFAMNLMTASAFALLLVKFWHILEWEIIGITKDGIKNE